jgi:hypothetical protein
MKKPLFAFESWTTKSALLLAALTGAVAGGAPAVAESFPTTLSPMGRNGAMVEVVDGELLLKPRAELAGRELAALLKNYGLRLTREKMPGGWIKVATPTPATIQRFFRQHHLRRRLQDPSGLADVARVLREDPRIAAVVPNAICGDCSYNGGKPPKDPHYPFQWNLQMLEMEKVWKIEHGSVSPKKLLIAVLDTGVAWKDEKKDADGWSYKRHADLGGRFREGKDCIDGCNRGEDRNAHGTHVAGIIHASVDNKTGIAGVAPFFTVAPVRVLDADGHGTTETLADGIEYVRGLHRYEERIINMSLAFAPGFEPGEYLREAVQRAAAEGIIMVAAAGNHGLPTISYPAAFDEVIAVGAVDSKGQRAPYSNYGAELDLVAPGGVATDGDGDGYPDAILSTAIAHHNPADHGYWFSAGTSQAAPHVAAVAALLLSNAHRAKPALSADEVRSILARTATDLGEPGWDPEFGCGLVNPLSALQNWQQLIADPFDPDTPGGKGDQDAVSALPTTAIGIVIDDEEDGLTLFLETDEGFFCLLNHKHADWSRQLTDRIIAVETWQLEETTLEQLLATEDGVEGWIEKHGGLEDALEDSGYLLGFVDASGGILGMLDASGALLGMLDASGAMIALLDASDAGFMQEWDEAGGISGLLEGNGVLLGMLDASGGMIQMLDASGGMLGTLDASGAMLGFVDASGAEASLELLDASGQAMIFFAEE